MSNSPLAHRRHIHYKAPTRLRQEAPRRSTGRNGEATTAQPVKVKPGNGFGVVTLDFVMKALRGSAGCFTLCMSFLLE